MKSFAKLVITSAVAMLVGFAVNANAAQPGYNETVIEAGKIKIVASVKDEYSGPTGFNGAKGVFKFDQADSKLREASWGARADDIKGAIAFKVKVVADSTSVPYDKGYLLKYMLELRGLNVSNSRELNSPNLGIDGASTMAYEAVGEKIFDKKDGGSCIMFVVVASMPAIKSGLAFDGEVCGKTEIVNSNKDKLEQFIFEEFKEFKKGLKISVQK